MPDPALLRLVADRLGTHPPQDTAEPLILAAFQGETAVQAILRGEEVPAAERMKAARIGTPSAVSLASIDVEGFRGIGEASTLHVDPGPGLTLVVGRNGSGKSSFSEALEMLLTGTNTRWKGRQRVWQDGWQNLHHRHTRIAAQFNVAGRRQPLVVERTWAEGAGIDESTLRVDGRVQPSLAVLGWEQPLQDYPPLLSHNELERALDEKQTALYDALAGILGLGELAVAQETLRQCRLALERDSKDARSALVPLLKVLEQSDDERAATVRTALSGKRWDIETVQRVVGGQATATEFSLLQRLNDIKGLPVTERQELTDAVAALREAATQLQRVAGTDSGRAAEVARLLEQALEVHTHADNQDCPVCGTSGVLTFEWRMRAGERMQELRTVAASATVAHDAVHIALSRARRLITAMPRALRDAEAAGIDVNSVMNAWERWAEVPQDDDPVRLAAHLESTGLPLVAAVAAARAAATAELERRERSWRPAAEVIMQWLPLGMAALAAGASVQRVSVAEKWLRDAHDTLREERFRPIADAVQQNWAELRQASNVQLGALQLTGTGASRKLLLDVAVDGESGSALGVMSQGELNCLALSLFLPRASLPESPFHFVVIDDPVQAMDPAKVVGLARVLERSARERQVMVLTHDTRLADAVRFLDLAATVIEVTRREASMVELRRVRDPVQRYIEDAFAVAKSEGLPSEAVRVIPGFCRLALEAACAQATTRRLIREGRSYAEVSTVLAQPTTLNMWLALALLGDASRGGDVTQFLQRKHPWAVDAVKECNRGAHVGRIAGDLMAFVRSVERFTKAIAAPTEH